MNKHKKSEVDYSKGMLHSHCGPVFHDDKYYCKAFIPGAIRVGRCEKVDGDILPDMWCELYHRVSKSK
jgi:hypothetical protein